MLCAAQRKERKRTVMANVAIIRVFLPIPLLGIRFLLDVDVITHQELLKYK